MKGQKRNHHQQYPSKEKQYAFVDMFCLHTKKKKYFEAHTDSIDERIACDFHGFVESHLLSDNKTK